MIIKPNIESISSLLDRISNKEINEVKELSKQLNIEFVNYDEFYNNLPDEHKKYAPPKTNTFFATINHLNNNARIVYPNRYNFIFNISEFEKNILKIIIEHELVHVNQITRRFPYIRLNDDISPLDRKKYFSDKDEVMAFSRSISSELNNQYPTNSINYLSSHRMFKDIKGVVDRKILNRYKKYIYQYLEN